MTPNESKTAIRDLALKYNISLEEAANQHGDLERFSVGLAQRLADEGLPEFQQDSGVLTGGASGLIDLVDRGPSRGERQKEERT